MPCAVQQPPIRHRRRERARAAGVEPRTTWFDAATNTAPEAAAKLGIEVAAIANSLVFTLDDEPIPVMASGGHRVDTDHLGQRLGGTHRTRTPPTW